MNATYPIETLANSMAHAAYQAFPEFKYKDRDWAKHDKWRSTLSKEEMKNAIAPADCYIEKTRKHSLYDLTVHSMFVQTWSSTALGFGGIGGQAITSAYVCIIQSDFIGQYAVYFGGRFAYLIERPNNTFFEHINNQKMVDAKLGNATYEKYERQNTL
jgi:hypothetical protein